MKTKTIGQWYLFILLGLFFTSSSFKEKDQPKQLTLLVIFDGLRSDYITPELMPNTYKLKNMGVLASNHQSIYPTLTRVNSAGFATGAYPGTNGILGNSVYFPSIDSAKALNTGDWQEVMRIRQEFNGKLYSSPTLAEILRDHGKTLMVFSNGSTGQSFLLNHIADTHGAIVNPQLILPSKFQSELEKFVGPVPSSEVANGVKHTWITDAYLKFGLTMDGPEVSILWFTDPDATAHAKGIGADETLANIKYIDKELGRVLAAIEEKGMQNQINILLGTDHGFVTHKGSDNIASFLIEKGFKDSATSTDVVVAGGAIYVTDKEKIQPIVELLESQSWIGSIFSGSSVKNEWEGNENGTFSLDIINFSHTERGPNILVDMAWNDDTNDFGYKGTSFSRGVAGHGNFSPYEMSIHLIAYGKDFKKHSVSSITSGNVDIAPTILFLQGIDVPDIMDGRVLKELFQNDSECIKESLEKVYEVTTNKRKSELMMSKSGNYLYPVFTRIQIEK